MLTQVGVKQLTDFLRTVTAASDLVNCTLVNCVYKIQRFFNFLNPMQMLIDAEIDKQYTTILVPVFVFT